MWRERGWNKGTDIPFGQMALQLGGLHSFGTIVELPRLARMRIGAMTEERYILMIDNSKECLCPKYYRMKAKLRNKYFQDSFRGVSDDYINNTGIENT